MARAFRLVRDDTRGHGKSETPPGRYSIEDVGRDVLDLLDDLGVERAHFAGRRRRHDRPVAAINAAERVDKLALLVISPRMGPAERRVDHASWCASRARRRPSDGTLETGSTEVDRSANDVSDVPARRRRY